MPDDPGGFAPGFVRVEAVSKRFGGFVAVDDVSLEIGKGELFALLGGSGCGKTTLLRMLAGFETPSSGRIFIDGQDMTEVPAYARPVNMMFQSYALFPHMTVEQNVGYGLTNEVMSPQSRKDRVREMLDLVKLGGLGGRRPHQISAASANASPSPAPSPGRRSCCSSTNRSPPSTRSCASTPSSSSPVSSTAPASPSSSSPTTRRRR